MDGEANGPLFKGQHSISVFDLIKGGGCSSEAAQN
jgi:hypothetical protein